MALAGAIAEMVLAGLVPVVAVVLIGRALRARRAPGRGWDLRLHGDAPPYPAKDVSGRLVLGDRLVWVTGCGAGEIDLTATGLYVVRCEPPASEDPTLVCVDGLGTGLRLSVRSTPSGVRQLERELRRRSMPEDPVAPGVAGPHGRVFGGAPALGLAIGVSSAGTLVVLATRAGAHLDTVPGQLLSSALCLTALVALPASLVAALFVRPLTRRRMRRARSAYRRERLAAPEGLVPAPRPAPVAFMIPPAQGELSWDEAAELARGRADTEDWQRDGGQSVHRPVRWWDHVLVDLAAAVAILAPVVWYVVLFVTDRAEAPIEALAVSALGAFLLGLWIEHCREDAAHRALLSAPSVAVPYVLARDRIPDSGRTLLLLAARELEDGAGHDGWLVARLRSDQRRLRPAGRATVHGRLAPGEKVVAVVDDGDRDTEGPLSALEDEDVRRLVTPLDVPSSRTRRRRRRSAQPS